jgi:two-component system, LuxR family, response regulator FixJ
VADRWTQLLTEGHDIVFVVDEDLAVRDSLKFFLTLEGFSVRACGSGAELLSRADLGQGRCLVMEAEMPDMDGFEVLARLSARGVALPAILITNYANATFRRRAATAGVEHIVEKPLLNGSLLERIREVLGLHRRDAALSPG